MPIVKENQLDNWVRGDAREAQGLTVELVYRLVAASCPNPRKRRFPLGDSIGQHGPDGVLAVDRGYEPFVPKGLSYWEIGTGLEVQEKASKDYDSLTIEVPAHVRAESTFVFVTPLSGRRGWRYTQKKDGQVTWLEDRLSRNDWQDVRVIDGTQLVDWIHHFLPIELWLAGNVFGHEVRNVETPERRWEVLQSYGAPPFLTPEVFLVNRESTSQRLQKVFDGEISQLKLVTSFPDQAVDYVCAYLASLREELRTETAGRSLIVADMNEWNTVCDQSRNLFLIAEPALDLSGNKGSKAIQKARQAEHKVIFADPVGGPLDSSSVPLPMPHAHQLKKALRSAGFEEQKAHTLSERCGRNLSSLVRILQGHAVTPRWAVGPSSGELAFCALLGSWMDNSEGDRAAICKLTEVEYEKWIGKVREFATTSEPPVIYQAGKWQFMSRYEGWYPLGRLLFDKHLDRFLCVAIAVLRERDPQFDLPPEERYLANVYDKVLSHSPPLRKGITESLALLGSHPQALASCTPAKATDAARFAIRRILSDSDWELWASLDRLLPLLAEASPSEFLEAACNALEQPHCPFDQLFSQEVSGIFGRNYLTGLLRALESLAWDEQFLVRVCVILGDLANRDPGGNWANRPANSLAGILHPSRPETYASVHKQEVAVKTLQREFPEVAWKLFHQLSSANREYPLPSHRPIWRDSHLKNRRE